MKKILKIISILIINVLLLINTFAYDLTEKDEDLIYKIDTRAFSIIDSGRITEQRLVDILKIYNSTRVKSERLQTILEAVIDDIEYEYYLGDYSDDYELEDDYLNNDFKGGSEKSGSEDYDEVYSIEGDNFNLEEGVESEKAKEVFELFTQLIPLESRKQIIVYNIYNNPNGDTYAYVEQNKKDSSKWNLTVNLGLFYKNGKLNYKESIHTLVHEYSHTLTLGKTQVKYDNYNFCDNYELQEGCLNDNSYLNTFITNFWVNDFDKSQKGNDNDFYTNNESNFVTEYASANPGEDVAESFTFFVLKTKPNNSTQISDKKILFFYKFKELVKLRNQIRKSLNELKK
ncbi:MAG: hypothetical protein Q9M94_06385 [Candidatus Gracilibacteria bacterium]|nr:hypothetical protein [Candidatus Gracilibacteria bacterium]MDQ7023730.1 hypothetical protein [Candidatus Gracilibacteria bacterium]